MKSFNAPELRHDNQWLLGPLAGETELLPASDGEALAGILPSQRQVRSLAMHRAEMTRLDWPLDNWVRAERDERQ